MLLTQLNETITRRAKSVEELQKLLDVSGSTGVVAISADTVELQAEQEAVLQNIITAGKLPFKFAENQRNELASLKVNVPTLRTLAGMERLKLNDLTIEPYHKHNQYGPATITACKLETLAGMPEVSGTLKIRGASRLKSLAGLKPPKVLALSGCSALENLKGSEGVEEISLMDLPELSYEGIPASCNKLDISYFQAERGLPWFIKISPSCAIKMVPNGQWPFGGSVPRELAAKILDYRERGKSSNVDMLEIQADLIDAGVDDKLAEI